MRVVVALLWLTGVWAGTSSPGTKVIDDGLKVVDTTNTAIHGGKPALESTTTAIDTRTPNAISPSISPISRPLFMFHHTPPHSYRKPAHRSPLSRLYPRIDEKPAMLETPRVAARKCCREKTRTSTRESTRESTGESIRESTRESTQKSTQLKAQSRAPANAGTTGKSLIDVLFPALPPQSAYTTGEGHASDHAPADRSSHFAEMLFAMCGV